MSRRQQRVEIEFTGVSDNEKPVTISQNEVHLIYASWSLLNYATQWRCDYMLKWQMKRACHIRKAVNPLRDCVANRKIDVSWVFEALTIACTGQITVPPFCAFLCSIFAQNVSRLIFPWCGRCSRVTPVRFDRIYQIQLWNGSTVLKRCAVAWPSGSAIFLPGPSGLKVSGSSAERGYQNLVIFGLAEA